jgi:hypothetical protein
MDHSNDHHTQWQRESANFRGKMNELAGNLIVYSSSDAGQSLTGSHDNQVADGKGDSRYGYRRPRS